MLTEFNNVKQIPGEGLRRWFSDSFFELIVWYEDDNEEIFGFQLCYDSRVVERALTWKKNNGYIHNQIDDGESTFLSPKKSPILKRDGLFDKDAVAGKFEEASGAIDDSVASFVIEKINEYVS